LQGTNVGHHGHDAGSSAVIRCVCVIHAGADCGDINALLYNNTTQTIYLGCKNMSLQWFEMSKRHTVTKTMIKREWSSRVQITIMLSAGESF
jgi:hypothetical protein